MLTAGTTTEVVIHHQNRGALMGRNVKGMASFKLLSVISEGLCTERFKTHAFQESSRNNPVGIDVITPQNKGAALNFGNQALRKIVGLRHEGSRGIKQQPKTLKKGAERRGLSRRSGLEQANIADMTSHGSGGNHGRAHQQRAAAG
jgi:hypothetical protein